MVNLFAYRSSHPARLEKVADPVGPGNDAAIARAAVASERLIVAWGSALEIRRRPMLHSRPANVMATLRGLGVAPQCLGLTQGGSPKHPLARGLHRIPDDVTPQEFGRRAVAS